jgi:hypothetical protein
VPIPAGSGSPIVVVGSYRPGIGSVLADWSVVLDDWSASSTDANGTEWLLSKVEGWRDRPEIRNSLDARPADHGAFDGPSYLGTRVITLEGTAICASKNLGYLSADIIASICQDPARLYTLTVTEPGRPVRQCEVRLAAATKVGEPLADGLAFDWNLQLIAPDPRRYATTLSTVGPLTLPASPDAGRTLPLTLPTTFPGAGTASAVGIAVNDGTFPTRPTVLLAGPSSNPQIQHVTSGRAVALSYDIAAGEWITLDFDRRTVMLNDVAGRAYALTPSSSWFELQPGSNELRYVAGGGGGSATVTWRSAWL